MDNSPVTDLQHLRIHKHQQTTRHMLATGPYLALDVCGQTRLVRSHGTHVDVDTGTSTQLMTRARASIAADIAASLVCESRDPDWRDTAKPPTRRVRSEMTVAHFFKCQLIAATVTEGPYKNSTIV